MKKSAMSASGVNLKERNRGIRETFIQFVLHVSDGRVWVITVWGHLVTEELGAAHGGNDVQRAVHRDRD